MLVYYFVPFIVSNRYLLFRDSNGRNSATVQNRTHVYMNFFDHKDLGNHLLQLYPKVVNHPVYGTAAACVCGCVGCVCAPLLVCVLYWLCRFGFVVVCAWPCFLYAVVEGEFFVNYKVTETSGRLHPLWPQNKWLHTPRTTHYRHTRQDRWTQTHWLSHLQRMPQNRIPLKSYYHKEGEQLEDRRSVGARSCNSGEGTDQRVQTLMFIMMYLVLHVIYPLFLLYFIETWIFQTGSREINKCQISCE